MSFGKIPHELRERRQWVCWRLESRDGKLTKIPFNVRTGKPASTIDPATWSDFDEVVSACVRGGYSGVGFVFCKDDPFCGLDFDCCRNPDTGLFSARAKELIVRTNSYAEVSQSGTGAHVIVMAKLPGGGRRTALGNNGEHIELYDRGRFFCMTGRHLAGTPAIVGERQGAVTELCAGLFKPAVASTPAPEPPAAVESLPDDVLILRAHSSQNGVKFSALWRGNWKEAGYRSHSEADLALLGMLHFWTGGDKCRSFRLFGASGLSRGKWNRRPDYRERCWAIVAGGDVYSEPVAVSFGSSETSNAHCVEFDEPAAYKPFPSECLPEPLQSLVVQGAESIGCDQALVALPLLAATAGAIGNARQIVLKAGWREPSVIWAVAVALSGDGKSPAFYLALDGLDKIQEQAFALHKAADREYKHALQRWRDAGSCGQKPEQPVAARSVIRDCTIERLALLLEENCRGVTLARDELSAWLGGFDKYHGGGRGEEVAQWLEMHRAGRITVDRKTGDRRTIHVPRAAVSIAGTVQPGTLERILEPRYFENGLVARLLLACPPRQLRQWNEQAVDDRLLVPVRSVFERLATLPMATDDLENPLPVDLSMTPDGKLRWIDFYNEHREEQRGLEDDRLGAAWAKLEGATARFALLFHCVRAAANDPTLQHAEAVDVASIEAAIHLTDWFKYETRRIYGGWVESADTRDMRRALECVQSRGGHATVRDLVRAVLCHGDSQRISAVLNRLVEVGRGIWRVVGPTERGGRPTRVFDLTHPVGETDGTDKTGESPQNGLSTTTAKLTKLTKPGCDGEVSSVTSVSSADENQHKRVSSVLSVSRTESKGAVEESGTI
jgi:hypothetical protein